MGREAIERLHFLASLPYAGTGQREGFGKTQPFNHFKSQPIKLVNRLWFPDGATGQAVHDSTLEISGPSDDIPVKVSGNVKSGFEAEFEPRESGVHTVLVEYNGVAVGGTPFYSKAYDARAVAVSDVPKSAPGKTVTFAGSVNILTPTITITRPQHITKLPRL